MVFLVRFLVSGFCSLVDLLSMAAFKSIAVVMVLVIHVLRVPGIVVGAMLKQVTEALVSTTGFIAESTTYLIKSAVSRPGRILLDLITESAGKVNLGVGKLVEHTKNAIESAPAKAGEFARDLYQLVGSINSLWNNLREAIAFVRERA